MIESLRIERLAIVEELELELGPGLNVLTGETGAGKSIVLGALGLLAGSRASSDGVRAGCDEGAVEAVFRTEALPELERELEERGFPSENHELVVRRSIASSGRSRARVANQLVPASVLAELFGARIEISSQHGSQSLLRSAGQAQLLDSAGGLQAERRAVADAYEALRSIDEQWGALRDAADERARRQDFLTFQRDEIDAANLEPGEFKAATAERARLAHADRLRKDGTAICVALAGDPARDEGAGATDLLASAVRWLEGMARLDPALAGMLERLRGIDTELSDAAADLERYVDGLDADPARLEQLEERLAQLDRLRRKYGDSVEEILEHRERVEAELGELGASRERADGLADARKAAVEALVAAAAKLTAGRRSAAKRLARNVERRLAELMLPKAQFAIHLESLAPPSDRPCGPAGSETVELQFTANRGEPLRSLNRVVSGGELSRVFLAVKGALRDDRSGMVLVFDEVDSGIGGRAAERIGRSLAELTADHQVLCITHLPQIAAFADVHFLVEKTERAGRTTSSVCRLSGDRRIDEIARMAGGESVGPATRRHAEALLRTSRSGRQI